MISTTVPDFYLIEANNGHIHLILEEAKLNNASEYMSRFCPSEPKDTLFWKMIAILDEIVGTVWLEKTTVEREARLGILIWNSLYQSKGIGRAVIEKVIVEVKNIDTIVLNVRRSNERAIRCYKSVGFMVEHEGKKETDDGIIDYYEMNYKHMPPQ